MLQVTSSALCPPPLYGRASSALHVATSPEFHPMSTGDVKAGAAANSDESFCSSDDQGKNSTTSGSVCEFIAPSYHHAKYAPPSLVDYSSGAGAGGGGGQSFNPLPFPACYPFPVLAPPASTPGLVPPPPGYVGLATPSRGRLQRQSGGAKSSTKLTSSPRTRSNTGM